MMAVITNLTALRQLIAGRQLRRLLAKSEAAFTHAGLSAAAATAADIRALPRTMVVATVLPLVRTDLPWTGTIGHLRENRVRTTTHGRLTRPPCGKRGPSRPYQARRARRAAPIGTID
jgi:hypothetical protein